MASWVGPFVGLALAVLGAAVSYGALRSRVSDLASDIGQMRAALEKIVDRQDRVLKEVSDLRVDVATVTALVNVVESRRERRAPSG